MVIDYVTECREATPLEKIAMDVYGEHQRYEIVFHTGESLSVVWSSKALDLFLPKENVSTILKRWHDNFKERLQNFEEALSYGEHPYHTTSQTYYVVEKGRALPVERYFDRPIRLTKSQKEWVGREISTLKEYIKGPLKFVAINNFEFKLNVPCTIYSIIKMSDNAKSMLIYNLDEEYVYYKEVLNPDKHGWHHREEGKIRKAEVSYVQYH